MVLVVLLASSASFGLGYLTGRGGSSRPDKGFWMRDVSTTSAATLPAAAVRAPLYGQPVPPLLRWSRQARS